jgi:hypothetical protein
VRVFAGYILRGRLQAISVAAVAAALAMLIPLFSHVAGGAVALVTLRKGALEGLIVAAGSAAVLSAFGYLSTIDTALINIVIGTMVVLIWLPALVTAQVLRATRSINLVLAVTGVIAAAAMLVFYLAVGDVVGWWKDTLQQILLPLLQHVEIPGLTAEDQAALIDSMARVMTGVLAATAVFTIMINLFLGRWLQALLFNPGGFGEEFRSLHLGRRMGILAVTALIAASLTRGTLGNLAINAMFVIGALYTLQGLSLVHAVVKYTHAHPAWLFALYTLMLFLPPQAALGLSAAGFADSWMDIRRRFRKTDSSPPNGES